MVSRDFAQYLYRIMVRQQDHEKNNQNHAAEIYHLDFHCRIDFSPLLQTRQQIDNIVQIVGNVGASY